MTEVLTATQPIRLKGRSFLALVLSPELPFDDWLRRLDDLAARSAGFFLQRPIVLHVEVSISTARNCTTSSPNSAKRERPHHGHRGRTPVASRAATCRPR
jgi:septum formation inhibitor MinC